MWLNELLLFRAAAEQGFLIATPGIGMGDTKLGVTPLKWQSELAARKFHADYLASAANILLTFVGSEGLRTDEIFPTKSVIPAQAGNPVARALLYWMPACASMTSSRRMQLASPHLLWHNLCLWAIITTSRPKRCRT